MVVQILQSVGVNQPNRRPDVRIVQNLLDRVQALLMPLRPLLPDGVCGPATIMAIKEFQRRMPELAVHDGIINPGGSTWLALQCAANRFVRPVEIPPTPAPSGLTEQDFKVAAALLDPAISPALLHAFADVESGGKSGLDASGHPKIAYEGHIFRKLTHHVYDLKYPMLSYPYKKKAGPEWQHNNKDAATAWKTLEAAAAIDHDAALQSCSWGMFQVMGFNFKACGYDDVDDFVAAMNTSRGQIDAFVGYCRTKPGMTAAMKSNDFQTMASLYNGDDYGDYDRRISRKYTQYGGK
jgi:N-acetylmuramidase